MTMEAPLPSDTPINRGERLARDVLYALMLEKRPWAEVIANRRAVVMETFRQFDAADEFEGMLAAQMAVAHSIFLGSSFLAVDRARPDGDRAHYLRQAARLMSFYRQHFDLLRRCRREREHKRQAEAAAPQVEPKAAVAAAVDRPRVGSHRPSEIRPWQDASAAAAEMKDMVPPAFAALKRTKPRLMDSTILACAQGP
jgi:hypothetical protein